MKTSLSLRILSCLMAIIFPAALFAADPGATAMLYVHGTTMLNGTSLPRSSAVFAGDLVQNKADSSASINATGSSVLIANSSFVQYEGDAVKLEHGALTVATSKMLAAHAGGVSITPAAGVWTEFEVRDMDGRVRIAAHKGDLTITDRNGTTTLAEGQQATRDEFAPQSSQHSSRKQGGRTGGSAPAAVGGILDSNMAKWLATGTVVGVTAWVLAQGDDPASPDR
jgi:hypothetical protein